MSATEFYIEKGYTTVNKTINIAEGAAVAAWTPKTSTRVIITDLSIASGAPATIAFYWGNVGGDKIAEFLLSGSNVISPSIGCWESTVYDRSLFARLSLGATDMFRVNLTGFEIP